MRDRLRCHVVNFRQASKADLPRVEALLREAGEGKVDFRKPEVLSEALAAGNFHLIEDAHTGELIGTGAVYPYSGKGRVYNELGTSVIARPYRSLGIADVSVALRSVYTMLVDRAGSLCVSEIYPYSVASSTVLQRQGYVLVSPDEARRQHALSVSPDPVLHLELPAQAIPAMAMLLLHVLDDLPIVRNGHQTYFCFSPYYMLHTDQMRAALRELSVGDLSAIGYVTGARLPPPPPSSPSPPDRFC